MVETMRALVWFVLMLVINSASSNVSFIGFGAPAVVAVRVGQSAGVSTVDIDVPVTNVGDGTPVPGNPPIFVGAVARHPFTFPLPVFTLSVDSSVPLSNGVNSIPFNEISWRSAQGDIPSGTFNGSTSQVILGPVIAAFVVTDTHTFSYANSQIYSAGTYVGRVTYTAAVL